MAGFFKIKKGFTLIELVISLTILSVIVIPLSTMFTQSLKTNSSAKVKIRANEVAQQIMERIKASSSLTGGIVMDTVDGLTVEETVTSVAPPTGAGDYQMPAGSPTATYVPIATLVISDLNITLINGADSVSVPLVADDYINLKIDATGIYLTNDPAKKLSFAITGTDVKRINVNILGDKNVNLIVSNDLGYGVVSEFDIIRYMNGLDFWLGNTYIICQKGSVVSFNNNYDSAVNATDTNRLYRVTVNVYTNASKDTKLIELTSFKKIF